MKENIAVSQVITIMLVQSAECLWVLHRLEVCPYKPRGLSLLGQSVIS